MAFSVVPSAIASDVMQVPLGSETPTIGLAMGHGLTISYLQSRRTIQKVWLDNPSWVTLDADGCLQGLSSGKCDMQGATSIHLRRIPPLPIPGLPKAGTSLLTVISRDEQGELLISTFRLVAGGTEHPPVVMVVLPNSRLVGAVGLMAIRRGKDVAITQGLMRQNDDLSWKVDQFLKLAETQPVDVAAKTAGISQSLVQRLNELGSREWGVGNGEERVGSGE